jgi:tetratricopeptide (TPR) repeat protein
MGNNEVVGPYGPGSAIGGRMLPLSLIRLGLWVQTTRTGQLVQSLVLRLAGTGRAFKDWRGMEMFAGKTVPADDPRLPEVYANFSANLADILAAARGAGVKVVLSTVAVNIRDSSPFVSLHRAGMSETDRQAWQESLDDATAAAELDDPARARASFDRALALDPDNADTHFLLAQFLGQQGGLAAARPHYLAALQQDALRFRADARINRIIRQAAATAPGEVFLVDAAQALGSDATSTGEPAGHELFFEHVHLTWAGNYALSRLLAKQTGAVLFGPGPAPGPWLDSTACAAAVGFTPFGRALMLAHMDELTDRPPFTGQRSFAAARNRLRGESDSIDTQLASRPSLLAMAEQVDAARRRDPANAFLIYHLAVIKTQLGDLAGALALNDRLLAVQPPSPEQAAQRAYLLEGLHRSGEAEAQLLASARSAPFYFQTYALLGSLWSATGQVPKALGYFAGLVARMPDSQGARLTYAQLLGVSGDEGAAERQWREILRLTPDAEAALAPLLQQLDDRHDGPAELTLLLNAFAYNPRSYANNARLLEYYDERNDLPNTVKFMQALAASGPVKAALHFDLAVRLRQLGRRNAALVEFHRARVAAQAENDQALLRDLDDPANQP